MSGLRGRFVQAHLFGILVVIVVTAANSYGYFHEDEYFQVLALAWAKLGVLGSSHLPWEYAAKIRPFMQPAFYVLVGRAASLVGVHDVFARATVFRMVTGLISWASLAAFVHVSAPWFRDQNEGRAHVRVATLLGMLPFLCVRTSSETLAMAAFTFGFAAVVSRCAGWRWLAGLAFGFAFEFRFQSVLLVVGLLAWLVAVRRDRLRDLAWISLASLGPVLLGAEVDRWGYGVYTPTPWTYLKVNLLEGVASRYGTDPPFAYAYLVLTNVFAPVVVLWLVAFGLTIARHPRHVVTWTTVPFLVAHSLLAHKEERFVFPMLLVATSFFVLGFGPGEGRPVKWATRMWQHRWGAGGKLVAGWNFCGMVLLAFYPLGWNHHARFYRLVHDASIEELHAYALGVVREAPPYTPAVFDVATTAPEEIGDDLVAGRARPYLVTPQPRLQTGVAALDGNATLIDSEMPAWNIGWFREAVLTLTDAYNAMARPPLRQVEWWSLYRLEPQKATTDATLPRALSTNLSVTRSSLRAPVEVEQRICGPSDRHEQDGAHEQHARAEHAGRERLSSEVSVELCVCTADGKPLRSCSEHDDGCPGRNEHQGRDCIEASPSNRPGCQREPADDGRCGEQDETEVDGARNALPGDQIKI
jgi:phosphatidylinositol glycan class B